MDLSIIIPHYKTLKLTEGCVESIFKYTKGLDFEVIVVDNASNDGSGGYLKKKFSKIKVIENKKNLGFGEACNIGASKAEGEYLCLLNSDILLKENIFPEALLYFSKNIKLGILAPRLVSENGSIQYSGGSFPSLSNIFFWSFFIDDLPFFKKSPNAYHMEDKSFYQRQKYFDWLQAACWVMPKKIYQKLAGFNSKYFMYVEDIDFCYRLSLAGYHVLLAPGLKVLHLQKGKASEESIKGEYRGLWLFFKTYRPGFGLVLLKFLLMANAFFRYFIFGILLVNAKRKKDYFQALGRIAKFRA